MASITFYHSIESACAHKVRLVMAEKGLDWEEKLINLRRGDQFAPEYLKLNPKAVVPTLVHHTADGDVVLRESTIINEYLDEAFPTPSLKPEDLGLRAEMRLWVKTVDEEIHTSTGVNTYAIALRYQMNAMKTPEQLDEHFAKMPDPARRMRQRSVHDQGVNSEPFAYATQRLYRFVVEIDRQIESNGGPWLMGEQYTLADAAALPYIMRLDNLTFDFMWKDKPAITAWYQQSLERKNAVDLLQRNHSQELADLVEKYGAEAREKVESLIKEV